MLFLKIPAICLMKSHVQIGTNKSILLGPKWHADISLQWVKLYGYFTSCFAFLELSILSTVAWLLFAWFTLSS